MAFSANQLHIHLYTHSINYNPEIWGSGTERLEIIEVFEKYFYFMVERTQQETCPLNGFFSVKYTIIIYRHNAEQQSSKGSFNKNPTIEEWG